MTEHTEARPYSPDGLAKAITRQENRVRALELAVQLHVARVGHGLTERGDEALNQDVIDTAMRFDDYLRDRQEPTS